MRFTLPALVIAGLVFIPMTGRSQGTRITTVDPLTAKVGDTVTANGDGIDAANVDVLYLTDGTTDIKVAITGQTGKQIKFKIPEGIKPGRWGLMIHLKSTTGPPLIEQPVKVTVQ